MPLLTIKVKAKRRPGWLYVLSAILSLVVTAFWAWVAYAAMGFSLGLARQVFITFGVLSLSFCLLGYLANERQVRNHASKALVLTGTAFAASLAAVTFYFIAKHEGDTVFAIVSGAVTIGLGVCISLFAIRYEFE